MDNFILYLKLGFYHVLDFKAYDHILFLIVLAVVFSSKQWKKLLWLITYFTIGHTLTLALSAYGILNISVSLIELLIPITIFVTAFMNIILAKKTAQGKENLNLFFALFFGLIHGLGFSNYFRAMIGRSQEKLVPLLEFALGVELAQVVIVALIVLLGAACQTLFGVSKRDWIVVSSAIVLGITIPMIESRIFW